MPDVVLHPPVLQDVRSYSCLAEYVDACVGALSSVANALGLECVAGLSGSLRDDVTAKWFKQLVIIDPEFTPEMPWSSLLDDLPELARQLYLLAQRWVDHRATALDAASRDANALELKLGWKLGQIEKLSCVDFSNLENSAVTRIQSGGSAVYYKPRDIRAEQQVGHTIASAWESIGLASSDVGYLDRGRYGWAAEVTAEACETTEQVARYYRRMGVVAALASAMGSQDLHGGNFIAAGEFPVLIDAETFIGSSMFPPEMADTMPPSLNDSFILGRCMNRRDRAADPTSSTRFLGALSHTDAGCRPTLDGRPVGAYRHRDDVVAGYERAAQWINGSGGEILRSEVGKLEPLPMRLMVRATDEYLYALKKCWKREPLTSWKMRRDVLRSSIRPLPKGVTEGQLGTFEASEVAALLDGLHPHFTITAGGLRVHDVGARVSRSACDGATRTLASAADRWLSDGRYLAAALQPPVPVRVREPAPSATDLLPTERLDAWVRGAIESAFESSDYPRWRTATRDPDTYVPHIDSPGLDLWAGSVGMGLALMCAAQELGPDSDVSQRAFDMGTRSMNAAAKRSLSLVDREPLFAVGVDVGGAGIAMALMIAADLAGDHGWQDVATALAKRCVPIPRQHRSDLLGGSAGVVLALVAAYQRTGDESLLEPLQCAIDQMLGRLARFKDGTLGFPFDGQHSRSWAHGDAGVICALAAASSIDRLSANGISTANTLIAGLPTADLIYPYGLWNGGVGHLIALCTTLLADPQESRFPDVRERVEDLAHALVGIDCGDDTLAFGTSGLVASLELAKRALPQPLAGGEAQLEVPSVHANPLRLGGDYDLSRVAYSLFAGTAGPALVWSGPAGHRALAALVTGACF